MKNFRSYLVSPAVFMGMLLSLIVIWLVTDPVTARHLFDNHGKSVVELITLPFFAAIVPLVWWKCPFSGSLLRRRILCSAVTCIAVMAVVKETDLHLWAMHVLFPEYVNANGDVYGLVRSNGAALTGTPFKMRFLTNVGVSNGAKAFVVFYFASFFGVFAVMLAYYFPALVKGFFRLNPVAWSVCCLGAFGVIVQLCDRMPALTRNLRGLPPDASIDNVRSFFTVMEEGGELAIAIFALIAIYQSYKIIKETEAENNEAEN